MYANPNSFVEINSGSSTFDYRQLSNTAKYYFSKDYVLDKENRGYKLMGNLIQGTIASDKEGYYTCFSTNKDEACQRLNYIIKYNGNSMTVSGVGYGTTSKEQSQSNDVNSTIKTYLDNWYNNNLKDYTEKLSKEAIFCNNRETEGVGYGLNTTYYYNNRKPDLTCSINDSFSVSISKGNGKLIYPVGLITADEAKLAGGIYNSSNKLYYLYSGNIYRTMSPSLFSKTMFEARNVYVSNSGNLADGYNNSWGGSGVRPVINIDPSKITFSGNGTMSDPYVLAE